MYSPFVNVNIVLESRSLDCPDTESSSTLRWPVMILIIKFRSYFKLFCSQQDDFPLQEFPPAPTKPPTPNTSSQGEAEEGGRKGSSKFTHPEQGPSPSQEKPHPCWRKLLVSCRGGSGSAHYFVCTAHFTLHTLKCTLYPLQCTLKT